MIKIILVLRIVRGDVDGTGGARLMIDEIGHATGFPSDGSEIPNTGKSCPEKYAIRRCWKPNLL